MTDHNLFKLLSKSESRGDEGKEYLIKMKTSAANVGSYVAKRLGNIKASLGTTALGTGFVSGMSLANSRKNKHTGRSKFQTTYSKAVDTSNKSIQEDIDQGKKPAYLKRLNNIRLKGNKDIADLFTDHPVKGAITAGTLLGYPAGRVGKTMFNLLTKGKR
jgi:hypothetical protein